MTHSGESGCCISKYSCECTLQLFKDPSWCQSYERLLVNTIQATSVAKVNPLTLIFSFKFKVLYKASICSMTLTKIVSTSYFKKTCIPKLVRIQACKLFIGLWAGVYFFNSLEYCWLDRSQCLPMFFFLGIFKGASWIQSWHFFSFTEIFLWSLEFNWHLTHGTRVTPLVGNKYQRHSQNCIPVKKINHKGCEESAVEVARLPAKIC